RRLGRTALVGLGASRGLPEGRIVSFGIAGALAPDLPLGTVIDATRVVDESGAVLWEGSPLGAASARTGTILGASRIVDDPGERARLHAQTGAQAVDMESGPLARSGRLVGGLRALSDTPARRRPAGAGPRGRRAGCDRRRSRRPGRLPARLRAGAGGDASSCGRRQARLEEPGGYSVSKRVLLAAPRSFCAGVDRAIEIVERLL